MEIKRTHPIHRSDIYYADLIPATGSEQDGIRPVLVIQNNVGNHYSPTVIAAAITGYVKGRHQPTHVRLKGAACGLFRNSTVLLEAHGFTKDELKRIAARIAQTTGATIIFC